MGIKRKVRERKVVYCCGVHDCGRETYLGWSCSGVMKQICKYHFKRHSNKDDLFSLFDIFGIMRMELGMGSNKFSEFGKILPHDYDEMRELAEKHRILEGGAKKEDSIERLNKWKAENGNTKRKRKPKPKSPSSRPDKKERQGEIEDIVNEILGD